MSDVPEFSPEVIDMAWQHAHAANEAYDRLQRVRGDIAAVGRVSRLALQMDGIAIDPGVPGHLEAQHIAAEFMFDRHIDEAVPVMLALNSPFTVENTTADEKISERTFATGEPLRSYAELVQFTEFRGYIKTHATRVWNILTRDENADVVTVPTFDDYVTPDEDVFRSSQKIRIARSEEAPEPYDTESRMAAVRVDIYSLRAQVEQWIAHDPKIENFAGGLISYLADYTNYALPNKEKLEVTHPPKPRQEYDYSAEGLLDNVHLLETKEEFEVVTSRALMRLAIARGDRAHSAPPFARMMANIVRDVLGVQTSREYPSPRIETDGVIYMGRNTSRGGAGLVKMWGFTPDAFRSLVGRLDADPRRRQAVAYLSERGFEVMKAFIQALDERDQNAGGIQQPDA
jgi:hypothetical protein